MTLTYYCMNCKKHFYFDSDEQAKLWGLMNKLNEARDLAKEIGLDGECSVPSTGRLLDNRAKCCDNPFLTSKVRL